MCWAAHVQSKARIRCAKHGTKSCEVAIGSKFLITRSSQECERGRGSIFPIWVCRHSELEKVPNLRCVGREEETVLGSSMTDAELLGLVAQGDQSALKQLYDRYAAHLNSFVQNYLADPQEAADIVHEAMLDVWRSAERFRGSSTVKSWMFSIARNKAIDRNRKGARTVLGEADVEIADDAPDPHKTLEAFQDAERVRVCIEGLNASQKSAIHLAFYEDLSYSQIAEIEKCPTGTVKTRIMAAKAALMRCLQQSE